MKILITGICGFVGSSVAHALLDARPDCEISGVDNFIRPGSEGNRDALRARGVKLHHGDVRLASDLESLPAVDWVIDAAANPSVLAGVDGKSSSRQVVEHNLVGTVNLLEHCRRHGAGFVLLSTSRVYSIPPLAALPVEARRAGRSGCGRVPRCRRGLRARGGRNVLHRRADLALRRDQAGQRGLALEYGETFGFPVWINRCGVLAGAGQFGRPDQGIVAYWINAYLRRRPLKYIGFGGMGHQVRDALHPRDLVRLLLRQMDKRRRAGPSPHGQPRRGRGERVFPRRPERVVRRPVRRTPGRVRPDAARVRHPVAGHGCRPRPRGVGLAADPFARGHPARNCFTRRGASAMAGTVRRVLKSTFP